ncbi:MAG: hypothetical protein O2800_07860 [Planctomycetota bacterium]|nr:hypothetical protein [Planctomycetota bacterium]
MTLISLVISSVCLVAPTPDAGAAVESSSRLNPIPVMVGDVPIMRINLGPAVRAAREAAKNEKENMVPPAGDGGIAGVCDPLTLQHTNSTFGSGTYIMQAGFGQLESAAVSFAVSPTHFPIKVETLEILFATSGATVQTTTEWSVMIFAGEPTAGSAYTFSSDGTILPHLVMPLGTTGMIIQFYVEPSDPDQIYISDSGSSKWSFGFRIDQHNNQIQNPCLVGPPTSSNAFPTTDTGGLQFPNNNWLNGLDCGAFGCPSGWKKFSQLSLCTPSGDWVMRGSYTPAVCAPPPSGACCVGTTCLTMTQSECGLAGGTYRGDGVACIASTCAPVGNVPCCFAATGGCVELNAANCAAAGGIAGTPGQTCAQTICFPEGACCLPNGSCLEGVSPTQCTAAGGTFQGDGTSCAAANCPAPVGAACFTNGFCLVLTEAQATSAGATWQGWGTTCADANSNGTADVCEAIPADINGDGFVNGQDLALLLAAWGTTNPDADIDGNGSVGGEDLAVLLGGWTG